MVSQDNFFVTRKIKVDLSAIGSRIKTIRGAMSQQEFATALRITQGHLSKIERGKVAPTVQVLLLLSRQFHTSADWILTGEAS